MLTAFANASARRIAVAGSWHPWTGFHRKVDGTRPMFCGLNTWTGVDRAALGPNAAGELEHVVLGGRADDRARVVQDDLG
jgi:hypothetical protein